MEKVAASLQKSGAREEEINEIINSLAKELYDGITTREIYNRAYSFLRKKNSFLASRYKLKKAIYELGPTGYPFERFVAAILRNSGYETEVGKILQGNCVKHELDIVARKGKETILIECKFHGEQGRYCDVKIPLYIHSRFRDIIKHHTRNGKPVYQEGWVVTNTRFTADALQYGKCVNLKLLSWDTPKGNSLKERIDRTGLYPITVSSLLSKREKQFLLSRDIVLCRELVNDDFYLDHLGISTVRKLKILREMQVLAGPKNNNK